MAAMTATGDLLETERTKLRRAANRGTFDRASAYSILDEALVAHVGISTERGPVVLPMTYGRIDDRLYLHGAVGNALLRAGTDVQICATVTLLDGLVLARSASIPSRRMLMAFPKPKSLTIPSSRTHSPRPAMPRRPQAEPDGRRPPGSGAAVQRVIRGPCNGARHRAAPPGCAGRVDPKPVAPAGRSRHAAILPNNWP